MHTNPLSKWEPIGWGAIKTHCTAIDSVAASRRLNPSSLDIFETPVTVTPQQKISKTLNSSNIPSKILNVYFWGKNVYFWGTNVYFWG